MEKDFVHNLYLEFKITADKFGPFDFLEDSDRAATDDALIWSVAEVDDGRHLINGLQNGPAVDWFLKATNPCSDASFSIDVFEVYVFDCVDCDDEGECEVCEGEGMVEIDFERVLSEFASEIPDPETLWGFRKPLGFDYE